MKNKIIFNPSLNIRSKNELSKHISSGSFSKQKTLDLINNVIENYDHYWHDSKDSKPSEEKYIRSAVGTPLGTLLKLINKKVLKPHDHLLPNIIFGGVSGKSHIDAAYQLLGKQKNRTLLKMDMYHFFEQNTVEMVTKFFFKKQMQFACF